MSSISARHRISRLPLRPIVLATALAVAGAAQAQVAPELLKGLLGTLTGQQAAQPGPPPVPVQLSPQAAAALSQAQRQASMPANAAAAALFAKGTVSGDELIGTLAVIRAEMRARKSAQALAVIVTATDPAALAGGAALGGGLGGGLGGMAVETFTNAATSLLKQSVSNVALQALDEHLQSMIEDPQLLSAESITLPPGIALTELQARRILTIAALTVGARVTGKVLERAKKDMESLRTDYAKLIDRREQAAKLLFAAIAERNKLAGAAGGAASEGGSDAQGFLRAGLNADDLAFVDKDLAGLSVAQFSKDLAAQNLALNYLQRASPEQFAGYRAETDDVVRRTKAYLRTMTGIAAFGALTVSFTQSVTSIAREKQAASLLQSLPLMKDFIVAAAPLAPMAIETAVKGVELSAGESGGFFSSIFNRKKAFLFVEGGKPQELGAAKDVFAALKKAPEPTELFRGALFRNDAPGLLLRVGECDRVEAGRMFDSAVPKTEREEFARSWFGAAGAGAEKSDGFSFLNAFDETSPNPIGEPGLALRLLGEDHRQRSSDQTLALSKVQTKVTEKFDEWGDAQLMRLIFVNREGRARHATLYLGETQIRPLPSAESLFAYETAAESCKKLLAPPPPPRPAATPAQTAKPPAKGAPKPAPKAPPKKENK